MDRYEQQALEEIKKWKIPELGWFGSAMRFLGTPIDGIGNMALDTAIVGDTIKKSLDGLLGVCGDAAHRSVRHDAIFKEFQDNGHQHIKIHTDIHSLHLREIDTIIGWLGAKYKGISLLEGAGAGAVGIAGVVIDIPALLTLNMRAIGEYATYYGFDIHLQQERLFALNVLAYASSPSDISKTIALAQLVKISKDVAKKNTWKKLEESLFVKIVQGIAKTLGIRLTKAKLAQVIPIAGALIGGGFNCYYTMSVCDAAYYLYRERHLAQKYGPEIIIEAVAPADSYGPDYPEKLELPDM